MFCDWEDCEEDASVEIGNESFCRYHAIVVLAAQIGPDETTKAVEEAHHCLQVKERPFNPHQLQKDPSCGS